MRQINRKNPFLLYITLLTRSRLYVTNLDSSKIQKEDLRRELYILFATYGPVLDVVALRTAKMRGQAHIVYRDIQTATQAMRSLQGFEFFGREMVSPFVPLERSIANVRSLFSKYNMLNQSRT